MTNYLEESLQFNDNYGVIWFVCIYVISRTFIIIIKCSAQGQVFHSKHRNPGCSSAEGRCSTENSGTKAAVLQGIE